MRLKQASKTHLRIRVTLEEKSDYLLLAQARGKSLSDIIRNGLNLSCEARCMCQSGKEMCRKCRLALARHPDNGSGIANGASVSANAAPEPHKQAPRLTGQI